MVASTFKWASAAGLATLAFAAPAQANPDTNAEAARLCGSGYRVVNDPGGTPARRAVKTSAGVVYGHVYLTYNSSSRKNCVVTIKSRFVGVATWTVADLAVQGRSGPCSGWYCDWGNFKQYAGGPPNYKTTVAAGGRCVEYYGYIFSGPNASGTMASGGRLSWGNCGG